MPFNSLPYLVFLATVVALYWVIPVAHRRVLVLLASLVFYASWNLLFVGIPLVVACVVYVFGKLILADGAKTKKWMWMGIGCVLTLLVFFKYRGFLLSNLNLLPDPAGVHPLPIETAVAFPMGISFYALEAIAYLIDVRQGRVKMPCFLDLCQFFLFWPNILSGPIVRARELLPQLSFRRAFEARFCFEGLDRIIWGLVQKNVIANVLGIWVDRGFGLQSGKIPSTIDGWFLAVAFGLQIYFDFAGYTNLALGAGRLLGITLPENFRFPYYATSPAEFWNRWHITLSRWIRDYLFFPINAEWKGAPLPLYLSLIGVMALVGLWHGAGWTYILWGSLHGTYLTLYRMYDGWKRTRSGSGNSWWVAGTGRVLTLVAITAAWVPFRAATVSQAGSMLASMFYRFVNARAYNSVFYVFTITIVLFCAIEPSLMEALKQLEERVGAPSLFHSVGRPVAYLFGLVLFLLFDQNNTQFIYSQF